MTFFNPPKSPFESLCEYGPFSSRSIDLAILFLDVDYYFDFLRFSSLELLNTETENI